MFNFSNNVVPNPNVVRAESDDWRGDQRQLAAFTDFHTDRLSLESTHSLPQGCVLFLSGLRFTEI